MRVARTINDPHAAAAKLSDNLILRRKRALDTRQQFGIGGGIYRIKHVGPARGNGIAVDVV